MIIKKIGYVCALEAYMKEYNCTSLKSYNHRHHHKHKHGQLNIFITF